MNDAPSKLNITLTIVGLLLTAAGLWVAVSEYLRKGDDARPVLDITEIKVIHRVDITDTNYVPSGEFDELSITYHNSGIVEAANVVVTTTAWDRISAVFHDAGKTLPLIHRPDMLPGTSYTIETGDDAIKGPSDLVPVIFRGRIAYTNRLNGHEYSEPWCFYTSAFVMMKDLPSDGGNTTLSIPLVHCPVGM